MSAPIARSRIPHILMVAGGVIPSTHIRLLAPFKWLTQHELVESALVLEHQVTVEMARWADLLIIQRSTSETGLQLIAHFKSMGKPVVYECDDNFLAITKNTPAVGEYYSRPDVRALFARILTESDVVTTSTVPLAAELSRFSDTVVLLPNCVDLSLIAPGPRGTRRDSVMLGYAGTITHGPDFEAVEPVLRRLLKEYGAGLSMQFFGFVPHGFQKYDSVSFVPYSEDYPGFLHTLSKVEWSFGVAPLADRPFNRYKTDNKYREYGACGIPGVYSDTPVYSGGVENGVNGLLTVHTQQGWYKAIKRMIEEPGLRQSISDAARRDVCARYSVDVAAAAWADVLDSALGSGAA